MAAKCHQKGACNLTSCPFVAEVKDFMRNGKRKVPDLTAVLQQDNLYKEFYLSIVREDVKAGYDLRHGTKSTDDHNVKDKHVIVVGAGIAGLTAAYELEKVGYKTTILEIQERVGGRIKTLHFDDELVADAGAMRIPPVQYLTLEYIKRFGIETVTFVNDNPETYVYIYGRKIKTREWRENGYALASELFPGWDSQIKKLKPSIRKGITNIDDYFKRTLEPVVADLCSCLRRLTIHGWKHWCKKWNNLSLDEFLRTDRFQDPNGIKYRPWPPAAVDCYRVSMYLYPMERSVVAFLRFVIGDWWPETLEAPIGGMSVLPERFLEKGADNTTDIDLSRRLRYGFQVERIEEIDNGARVAVSGRKLRSGKFKTYEADAVIVTLPLTILRQINIDIRAFDTTFQTAMSNIHYIGDTKIFIQCSKRFWEADVGSGGKSKTSLPIGELYYLPPSNEDTDRGILLCYAWAPDALIMGSMSEGVAVDSTLRQIARIHPEVYDYFEFGKMQAWFSDPSAQGAYVQLLPFQYDYLDTLMKPTHPMYLAGEAISHCQSWIQGAIESSLNAVYSLYSRDREAEHK